MVVHVLEAALKARSLDAVIVAADHQRIVDAVRAHGGEAILTREDHPNGTSRLAEVAERTGAEILVNIQGDEPEIEPEVIDAATELLLATAWADVATIASPFAADEDPSDPNLVKVVLGADGRALGNDGGFLIPGREDFLGGQRLCIRSAEGGVSPHDGGANGKFDHASRFTCA